MNGGIVGSQGNTRKNGKDEEEYQLDYGEAHDDVLLQVKVGWSRVHG